MDPDWDITSNIIAVATDIPGISFQYVRGHQDRTTAYDQLPLLAQLNVDTDEMANRYQRDHGKSRTTVLPTNTSGVYLNTTAGSITKRIGVTVRYQATAPALISNTFDTDTSGASTNSTPSIGRHMGQLSAAV